MNKVKCTKGKLLKAIDGTNGIVSDVARRCGVCVSTVYNYLERYPDVAERLEVERGKLLDLGERELVKQVKRGNIKAIMFLLERRGASRGWGVRQDVELRAGNQIQPIICFESTRKESEGLENE